MSLYKIQGKAEKRRGIYYEFDSEDEPLGVGGMGQVYKGRCVDETTGRSRDVAIKFMYSDLPPYAIEKARREAAIQLRHDNLVEMLGFIETETRGPLGDIQPHYHVVSELLMGVSLEDLFKGKTTDQSGRSVPLAEQLLTEYRQNPPRFAVKIIKSILSGLMMMHDASYIHRDIDPTNIMITTDGRIKLIDFGIAKKVNSLTTSDKHLTQTGQFVGKPEYAAPELVLGAIDEQNATTDIYAVGILLFQCLTGHVPFEGDRSDILQKQVHTPLPLKQIKHKALRRIIERATEKQRAKRFSSAAEFRVALEQVNLDGNTGGGGFEWKPLYTYIAGGVAAAALIVAVVLNLPKSDGASEPDYKPVAEVKTESKKSLTYEQAVKRLYSEDTAKEGLAALGEQSRSGNADATFLLARLYFVSKMPDETVPDSIRTFQENAHPGLDYTKSHMLLLKTVEQNPRCYQAYYELAMNYWKADQRTDAVPERDGMKASNYFEQAETLAEAAGDNTYIELIKPYKADIQKWLKNVKDLEKKGIR